MLYSIELKDSNYARFSIKEVKANVNAMSIAFKPFTMKAFD